MNRTRRLFTVIWIAFFVSGTAGLVYEVVWARYLDLILGGTTYAHIMVLAAYMGGLASGAWFFGRLSDRLSEPLVIYSYLEMAIGVYGLAFPIIFSIGSGFYIFLAGFLGTTGIGGVVNKLLIAVLLLGPSTFMMGGTLPLLTRAVTVMPEMVGRRVSGLYFINSSGAVFGALAAGFFLIRWFGVQATLTIAAALNIAVGVSLLAAWRYGWLSGMGGEDEEGLPHEAEEEEAEPQSLLWKEEVDESRLRTWATVALWGAGLSGLVVMVYEVSWIRLLSTILGSSTYSFTLMLAAFITGIALGSLLARWLARYGRPFFHFGLTQFFIGASLLVVLPLYSQLPYAFLSLQSIVAHTDSGYALYETVKYLFCLAIMLPPTLASGAALPLATDVAARLSRKIGSPVGRIFAINTFGTILGALMGGLVLLPVLGVRHTLELGIAVNMLFGLWVLFINPHAVRWRKNCAVGAVVLTAMYLMISGQWDLRALASGVFRERLEPGRATEQYRNSIDNLEVVFYEEDVNGTVAVLKRGTDYSLIVNGKADASSYRNDSITQTLIAAIPAMMVPDAERAMVIGLGSGQTAGHLLEYPLKQVEIIEISPGVVKASHFFDYINGTPLEDPRTTLVTQDARTYLLTRPDARYDLILSEPSNPWIAGIGGLFTIEYFSSLRDRLNAGGVAAQWIHTYEQTNETLGSVLLTFCEAFPHVSVWGMSVSDLLLVGSNEPIAWDFDASEAAFERSGVADDLEQIGVNDLFTLLSRQIMSPLRVREAISLGGRLNTNNFPFLEYQAPRAFFLDSEASLHREFDERNRTLRNTDLELARYMTGRKPSAEELLNSIAYFDDSIGMLTRLKVSAAAGWLELDPDAQLSTEMAEEMGHSDLMATLGKTESIYLNDPSNPDNANMYADALLAVYDLTRSAVFSADRVAGSLMEILPLASGSNSEKRGLYTYRLGQVLFDQGLYEEAIVQLNEVVAMMEAEEQVDPAVQPDFLLIYLGKALMKLDRFNEAIPFFQMAYELNPGNSVAAFYFAELRRIVSTVVVPE